MRPSLREERRFYTIADIELKYLAKLITPLDSREVHPVLRSWPFSTWARISTPRVVNLVGLVCHIRTTSPNSCTIFRSLSMRQRPSPTT